jgi:hypothetical protein
MLCVCARICYAIGDYHNTILLNFIQSVIIMWLLIINNIKIKLIVEQCIKVGHGFNWCRRESNGSFLQI